MTDETCSSAESVAKFADTLRKWWSFNDRERHTHSLFTREEFIDKILPELLAAPPQAAGLTDVIEQCARIVERWSLPTIQTPSMWLVDKAGIAAEIRSLSRPQCSEGEK